MVGNNTLRNETGPGELAVSSPGYIRSGTSSQWSELYPIAGIDTEREGAGAYDGGATDFGTHYGRG